MKLYDPDLLYLLIAVGAIVTAALIWLVALLWRAPAGPRAAAARPAPALPDEISDDLPDGMVRTASKIASFR